MGSEPENGKQGAVGNIDTAFCISTPFIKLSSALKLLGIARSGGDAKTLIKGRLIKVNGEECTMRGKKIYPGDRINFKNSVFLIEKYNENT